MAGTVHEIGARACLDELMSDPAGAQALHAVHQGLNEGRWSTEYVDAIGQGHWSGSARTMEQIAVFGQIHSMVTRGLVAMVPVSTGGPPRRDSEREANAAALARLPHPFTASVNMEQNCGDFDGMVTWTEPIEVSVATGLIDRDADGSTRPWAVHYMIPPGSAPLEIGSSLPSRTYMHLVIEGGTVARWPYGHSRFRLFVNFDYMDGMERLAERVGSSSRRREDGAATRRERERSRRACAALGHPRTMSYADVIEHGGEPQELVPPEARSVGAGVQAALF